MDSKENLICSNSADYANTRDLNTNVKDVDRSEVYERVRRDKG